ncbi:hypothetical protein [Nostoc sp.]
MAEKIKRDRSLGKVRVGVARRRHRLLSNPINEVINMITQEVFYSQILA